MNLLKDKIAFISGGTSGINLAIAKTLASQGAKISIIGRDTDKGAKAAAEIDAVSNSKTLFFSVDVRDYDAVEQSIAATAKQLGSLDIVIAGAAGNFFAPAVDINAKGFKTVVDIDLMGTYHVLRAGYDHCTKGNASFIAITAPQAINATPLQSHVCAAKAGVNALVKNLALEWGAAGIRVNAISPGLMDGTEGLKRLFASDPENAQKLIDSLPMKALGNTEEIGKAAVYLSSELASYVTGVIHYVDGGYHLGDASTDCITPRSR
jgi:NAD(P)-dependent dehydrogenase (short-subunit alcohol dehydrogenase family)